MDLEQQSKIKFAPSSLERKMEIALLRQMVIDGRMNGR